jgi:hypothetical protein
MTNGLVSWRRWRPAAARDDGTFKYDHGCSSAQYHRAIEIHRTTLASDLGFDSAWGQVSPHAVPAPGGALVEAACVSATFRGGSIV